MELYVFELKLPSSELNSISRIPDRIMTEKFEYRIRPKEIEAFAKFRLTWELTVRLCSSFVDKFNARKSKQEF